MPETARRGADASLAQLAADLGNAHDVLSMCRRLRAFLETRAPLRRLLIGGEDAAGRRACLYAYEDGAEQDPASFDPPSADALVQPRGVVVVPLRLRDRLVGAIEIHAARDLAPDDVAAIHVAATLAALAGENARLRGLARRTRELEAFSFTAAHDLRAPLRAILALSEDLERDPALAPESRAGENARAIHASSAKMASLVEDLLRFARSTQGELRRERVDLTAMARAILAELCAREPQREARLIVEDGLVAHADASLVRILLDNLLGNAWKYSATKPVTVVRIGARREGADVVFEVEDEGVGFDGSQADRLFRAFERLAPVGFEGTGLGLATARRIVQRHGGRIWARGRPGKGATLSFTLGTTIP